MEKQQKIQNWPKLDIIDGQVKTYFEIPTNKIHTQYYSLNIHVMLSIVNLIINPSSLILILSLALSIVLGSMSPHSKIMVIMQLVLTTLSMIIRQILIYKSNQQSDQKINKRTAKVFRGNQQFQKMEWGEIKQGDIVYLCQGQVVPADIILLDTQQIQHRQAITYVDTKNINGQTVSEKKKSCYLTQILNRSSNQKRVWQQYKKIITGRITFQKPSSNMQSFNGYFKLSKDPKVQKLSIQNLILRQSIIKTSLWVYGFVLYTGMDSKVMKSFKQQNNGKFWTFSYQNKLFLVFFLANIILCFIFSGLSIYNGNQSNSIAFLFCYHFLMFTGIIPHLRIFAKNVYFIFLKITKKMNQFQIRSQENIKQLGQINFAIISNVGVLTDGQLQVKQIVTQSSIYDFQSQNIEKEVIQNKKQGMNRRRLGSSLNQDECNNKLIQQKVQRQVSINNRFLLPIMNYDKRASALIFKEQEVFADQNFQIDDDTNIRLKQSPVSASKAAKLSTPLEPLKLDRNRFYNYVRRNQNESTQIIKTFGLCHQAKLYYVATKEKYQGVSNFNSQQVLLKLVNYVGWNIIPKTVDKKQVGLTLSEQKQKINEESGIYKFETIKYNYFWIGINSFSIPRKIFSVVVSIQNKYILYCKGKPEDILQRLKLSKQTQKTIQQTTNSYAKRQSEVIIYAKRQLSQQQKQIYENDYISLKSSLTTNEIQIQQFSKKYQKNLDFICIVGMAPKMNPQAEPFIKYIKQCGIKPCIFVRQNSETILVKKMILQEDQKYNDIQIDGQSVQLIRYHLNQASNLIKSSKSLRYLITLSGASWKTIQSNSELMQHFMFVLYYAEAIITVNFKSQDIGQITQKIVSSYPQTPRILGIGHSYSDLKFLSKSTVSIGTCQDLSTDIKVDCLSKIIQALKYGPYLLKVKLAISNLVYYRIITMFSVMLIYQAVLTYFGVQRTVNGYLVFFYLVIYTCLQLIYTIFNLRNPQKIQQVHQYTMFSNFKNKNYIEYIEALLHGIIITSSLISSLGGAKTQESKLLPIQAFDLSIFITLILVGCFRNVFKQSFSKLSYIFSTITTLSIMTISVYIFSLINNQTYKVSVQFFVIITTYDSLTCILNCTVFCLGVSLFMQQIIKKIVLAKPQKRVKNTDIQKNANRKKMIQLIQHLYRQQESMQTSIQQIVSTELDVNNLKINKFLQIKKEQDNTKYLSQKLNKNKSNFLKLNITLAIFFASLVITHLCIKKQFQYLLIFCLLGFSICLVTLSIIFFKHQLLMWLYKLINIQLFSIIVLLLVYIYKKDGSETQSFLLICCISVIFTQSIQIKFCILIYLIISVVLCGSILAVLEYKYTSNKFIYPLLEFICIIFNFVQFYQTQKLSRVGFVRTLTYQRQSNYVNDILSILVPKFIKNHLQGNEDLMELQQQQHKVSILFCYVCNFDQIVKEEGTNVVSLMDQLFRQFDQLCHNFAVQKIETVGQTYMAATGLKAYENQIESQIKRKKNQVQRLLKMAIQMLEKSKDIMWGTKKNKKLNIKIGIHHGNVIIGVIGYHKPQFSLIGDTVNTTSRHCSTAAPGQIIISHVAYEFLKKYPTSSFTKSKKMMKGLGQVPVFKYNNNSLKQESHTKMRIKFQNVVKKVIQNLKSQGKIQYKKFKASQFAEKVMFYERINTKKTTRISNIRKTIQLQNLQPINKVTIQKQNKYADLCLKYNRFMEPEGKSTQYKKNMLKKDELNDKKGLCILALLYIFMFVLDVINKKYTVYSLVLYCLGLAIIPIMFILYRKSILHKSFNILYVIAHAYLIFSINIFELAHKKTKYSQGPLQDFGDYFSIMAINVCSSQKAFRLIHTTSFGVFVLLIQMIILIKNNEMKEGFIYQVFFFVLILLRKHYNMKEYYDNYNQSQIDQKRTQQQSALVSQLLPKHAYEKLKNQNIQNRLQLTDRFEGATILFADIKGFTAYSNKNSPSAVVKMLRHLFQQFDKLCLKYNVYKVYTIGDCYVVLGFTNCYQRDYLQEAKNVVNMGLAMVQTIQRVRQSLDFNDLDMRIGVHTGTIIGGIIGTDIVRYDIYGPDVMVANKFQQYGKTGFIHISQSTKEILDQDKKKNFNIAPNGIVKVQKLNAQYNGYILTKKKFQI